MRHTTGRIIPERCTTSRTIPEKPITSPPPADEAQRHWTQALCVFQLVSVDLILLTLTVWLLALTDILPARQELACLIATWLGLWCLAWLVQLAAVKSTRKNYGLLGQWVLFLVCAGLMCWGAQG